MTHNVLYVPQNGLRSLPQRAFADLFLGGVSMRIPLLNPFVNNPAVGSSATVRRIVTQRFPWKIREASRNRQQYQAACCRVGMGSTYGRCISSKQGKVAHTAIPRLIEIVGQDPDLYLRKNVLNYLYRLGNTIWEDPQPDPPANESTQPVAPTMRHLVECLAAESRHVRAVAAHLIGCFGRASYFTEFQLVKKLPDDNQKVRLNAATALRRIGAESETTVGALSAVAKNPEEKGFVWDRALVALGSMVPFLQPKATIN